MKTERLFLLVLTLILASPLSLIAQDTNVQQRYEALLDSEEPEQLRQKGEVLIIQQHHEDALRAFDQYITLRPDDPQGDVLFLITAFESHNYIEAIEIAKRILSRNDNRSKLFHAQAYLLLSRGYYSKGLTYQHQEKRDSARIFYSMAAEAYGITPDSILDANDYLYHGISWMQQGDTAQGIQIWNSMIQQFPDSCALGYTLTKAIYSFGRYEDALASLNNFKSLCGQHFASSVSMLRGLIYRQLDQKEKAIESYNKAIKLDSTNVDVYYRLLNILAESQQYESIPAIVDRMAMVVPVEENEEILSWCYYFKGVVLFNNNQPKEAIISFERTVELKKNHSQGYLYMAICYHTLKDKKNACENYQKALQYDPDNQYAKENIGKLNC